MPALAALLAMSGSFATHSPVGAAPTTGNLTPYLAANAKPADDKPADAKPADDKLADDKSADDVKPIPVATPDAITASGPVAAVAPPAATPAPTTTEAEPVKTAALTDPAEAVVPETPANPRATSSDESEPPRDVNLAPDSTEIVDECFVLDICVDRYLWTLYQRAPKEDSVREDVQRAVTVRKKGKSVTVMRTVGISVDEDFAWKDVKAAEHAGLPMSDYVIGGMDRAFKLRLFYMLHAAEAAGLSPGITSAFRDDYRQSIASGLKAANDRSFHGGSFRGGYGHGLAADIVSVNGATRAERLASTQVLWKWVDARGKDYGIGRPYLGRDPPHMGPIDGEEYAKHRLGVKPNEVAATARSKEETGSAGKRKTAKHTAAKHTRTAASS
ncbi:hypothetical protein [Bradyrhizobium genosp. P]|uniref:hypothetical protein n=1 Tax=Bradyrhizobium genosp. P TaxID=83641 RepID=UPI003CF5E1B2